MTDWSGYELNNVECVICGAGTSKYRNVCYECEEYREAMLKKGNNDIKKKQLEKRIAHFGPLE